MATPTQPQMRAARLHDRNDVRVETISIPFLQERTSTSQNTGDGKDGAETTWLNAPRALVQVEWCGICGSDLHNMAMAPANLPTPSNPHPLTKTHLPSILGHELCGTIVSSHTSTYPPGTRVTIDPRLTCHSLPPHGPCASCDTGRDHQCPLTGFTGYSGAGGGFAEYVLIEERMLHVLPQNVGLDVAALCEPLAVAHHAVKIPEFSVCQGEGQGQGQGESDGAYKGKTALIVGGGPVGYAVILALKAAGCEGIVVSEPTKRRREDILASGLVSAVVDPRDRSVGEMCREVSGGAGVDVAFECAGVQKGLESAIEGIKLGGWVVVVSIWETPISLPFLPFWVKEMKLTASLCYNEKDFKEVMENIGQGKYPGYEKMVTSRISLEDVVTKGFEELINNKDEHIKILVTPKKELLK